MTGDGPYSNPSAAWAPPRPRTPVPPKRQWWQERAWRGQALAVWTRQLAAMLQAGLPLVRALEVLLRQERRPVAQALLQELAAGIRAGGTLAEGLAHHPAVFSTLYVNMVRAGEASGALAAVLERLARFLESAERTRGKVKAAMVYPATIMVVAGIMVTVLLLLVVPRFQQLFADQLRGQPLPWLTQAVIGGAQALAHYWFGWVVGGGVLVALARWAWRTPTGRRTGDAVVLRLPLLGELWQKTIVARFARTSGTLLSSGVPILSALDIARCTTDNVPVAEAIHAAMAQVQAGEPLAQALAASPHFPPLAVSLVAVGEETGALPEMLTRVADIYDEEAERAIVGLTALIEPAMILLMAGLVGGLVLALFLPIVRIIQLMSGG